MQDKKSNTRKHVNKFQLPFEKMNYVLFLSGLAVIIIGYLCLAKGPWDSFCSLTLAPILLVLGYCVIVPVAILYRKKEAQEKASS